VIAGVHATTATLIALHVLETESRGQIVDLSVQEAVAHSIENAAQYVDLEGVVRRRAGAGPQEAGTGLFRCADGWIYLVGRPRRKAVGVESDRRVAHRRRCHRSDRSGRRLLAAAAVASYSRGLQTVS
jgi:crotonobetainyl-CoA:carnitine CoA-transferase CaiB-like acyl-CoA transferase